MSHLYRKGNKMIDWTSFTPATALAGGLLIGVAAAMLALLNGRIAGVSGILGGLLLPGATLAPWRLAFLAGMIGAPLAYTVFARLPGVSIDAGYPALVVAGLLVGLSTRYAAGCTSGHGVCGIARLSPRSLLATLTFMATGFMTVFVVRHLIGG